MTTPENMEIFDRICIALFDKLYSEFPVPIDINMSNLAMSAIRGRFCGSLTRFHAA